MIYLVGAGPGDPGLMTLRGREVLSKSDVVIYDRLVGDGVLAMIPESAEAIDVGKIPGSHKISQRDIEDLIITKAKSGRNVTRLKGGDPFMFGRGGEEAEAIMRAGLDFEVVPGVSSALAVPAWAGVPATHRDFCGGVNIFTAHDKDNMIPDFEDATSIFLMGVGNSGELQRRLLTRLEAKTPCAVIANGTTARQHVIRTSLGHLHEACGEISPPAVIVVGRVAELNLDWRGKLPLSDKKILITRPAGRSETLAAMLRDAGAEVVAMPTIKTSVIKNSLDEDISSFDWVGFTSVTGVEAFFTLLSESGRDVRELGSARIAAIGRATAEALKSHGLRVEFVPEVFDGKNLAEGLAALASERNEKVLMFRALEGTPEIAKVFEAKKITYKELCVYRTDYVKLNHVPDTDMIIFTSASTVRAFAASVSGMREVRAVCIGRQTAEEAGRVGFVDVVVAERATVEAIFKACCS